MANDPFRYLSKVKPNVRTITHALYSMTRASSALRSIWIGSGWRANSVEHATGYAVDIIISSAVNRMPTAAQERAGDMLANWFIANHRVLRFRWIIWKNRSWNPLRGTWKNLGKRGSISAKHLDHIHVLYTSESRFPTKPGPKPKPAPNPTAGTTASIDQLARDVINGRYGNGATRRRKLGAKFARVQARVNQLLGTKPAPKPKPKPVPKPSATARMATTVSVAHLKAARYADPPKRGTPAGPYGPEVLALETALAKTGWLASGRVDQHYGWDTVHACQKFQRKHSGARKPDGWLGPRELRRLFKLAKMRIKVTR